MQSNNQWLDVQPLWDVITEGHNAHIELVKQQQSYRVHGFDMEVLPGVYHCHEESSSLFFLRHLPLELIVGKTVLEIGCGSGLIGMYVAVNGASQVVLADIAQSAIDCTRHNLLKNNLSDIELLQSDLFSAFEGRKFDVVLFNGPFYDKALTDDVEGIFCDPGMKMQQQFIADCIRFLNPGGIALLSVSNIGNTAIIKALLENTEILGIEMSETSRMSKCLLEIRAEKIPLILKSISDQETRIETQ
jgi:release factor glutamine methyltransferase